MKRFILLILVWLALMASASVMRAGLAEARWCDYELTRAGEETGAAHVEIHGRWLLVSVENARPDVVYTIWVDHRNRATGQLADDYPVDQGALARGVAPAFGTRAPVYSGMRMDLNGFRTNSKGSGFFLRGLDYSILRPGRSPVVAAGLGMQGLNRVGGQWLRTFAADPDVEASAQVTNNRGIPVLPRSTAQGLTIVAHVDNDVTHGMTPGVGGVDHVPAWAGDFPAECVSGEEK